MTKVIVLFETMAFKFLNNQNLNAIEIYYGIYSSANSAFLRLSSMAWRFPL